MKFLRGLTVAICLVTIIFLPWLTTDAEIRNFVARFF